MINLPGEIIDLILEYLPVKDFLNAFLVSKKWRNYLSNSSYFKQRIIVNSSFHSAPKLSKNRDYRFLTVRKNKINHDTLSLMKDHQWQAVSFHVQKVPSQKLFVEIIGNLSHVEELKVNNVAIRKLNTHKKLILPQMTTLIMSDVAIDTFETFFDRQPSLKCLSLRFITSDVANPRDIEEYLAEFLVLNSHIKELDLYCDVVNNLFKLDISKTIPLELKSLTLNLCYPTDVVINNIQELLKSQENSLEELGISYKQKEEEHLQPSRHWYEGDAFNMFQEASPVACENLLVLFKTWNSLKGVKKLTLRFFESYLDVATDTKLLPNTNLKNLIIKHINCTIPMKNILIILQMCPNLVHLYITNLNKNVILFCARNLKLLKSISYSIDNESSIAEYNQLIGSNEQVINKFIKFRKEYLG